MSARQAEDESDGKEDASATKDESAITATEAEGGTEQGETPVSPEPTHATPQAQVLQRFATMSLECLFTVPQIILRISSSLGGIDTRLYGVHTARTFLTC